MDYLTLITQQKQDKLALIEDEEEYTKMVEGYKKMIKTGIPVTDWGVVKKDGKTYYIQYVL